MAEESVPVTLARQSLLYYLANHKFMPVPGDIPAEIKSQAGVFVSFKKRGELRGCIGTFGPTQPTAAAEIIRNAVSAGTEDPRFRPIEQEEIPGLEISVDILSSPERIAGPDKLNPKVYGVIVRKGQRSGLLLPDLEGVDTIEEQVGIARQKAGIRPEEVVELYRFSVTRYK